MEQERTVLRGHHVECLAERHSNASHASEKQERNERESIDLTSYLQSPVFRENNSKEMYKTIAGNEIKPNFHPLGEDYQRFQKEEGDEFLQGLLANPEEVIVIGRGHDSLCGICPRFASEECPPHEDSEGDSTALVEFGLELGESYSIREILEKVRAYQKRTGFASPRQKRSSEEGTPSYFGGIKI